METPHGDAMPFNKPIIITLYQYRQVADATFYIL